MCVRQVFTYYDKPPCALEVDACWDELASKSPKSDAFPVDESEK